MLVWDFDSEPFELSESGLTVKLLVGEFKDYSFWF
jgi:hypothetical protein